MRPAKKLPWIVLDASGRISTIFAPSIEQARNHALILGLPLPMIWPYSPGQITRIKAYLSNSLRSHCA